MEGDEINQRKLDTLIQWIDEAGDRDVIIDNGARHLFRYQVI